MKKELGGKANRLAPLSLFYPDSFVFYNQFLSDFYP